MLQTGGHYIVPQLHYKKRILINIFKINVIFNIETIELQASLNSKYPTFSSS